MPHLKWTQKLEIIWYRGKLFSKQALVFTCVQYKSFENTVGKGEIAQNEQFLLFPQCFLLICITLCHFYQIWNCCLQFFQFGKVWNMLFNPFPNKPWFLRVCSISLLKILWEKEKLLVTSNFSFSHSVFYPFGKLSAILIKVKIVVCKLFQFGRV